MWIFIDLIIVAIIIVSVILSARKGFVKSAVECAGFVLAIVLAFSFGGYLSEVTYDGLIKNAIVDTVEENLDSVTEENGLDGDISDKLWDALPEFFTDNAENFGIEKPEIDLTDIADAKTWAENITEQVARPIIITILKVAFGAIIFLLVCILTKLLAGPINKLFSISVVGTFNRVLGGGLGLLKGFVWAIVFCAAISAIVAFTKSGFLIFTKENLKSAGLFSFITSLFPIV